ncbi:outer membrane lipoprotein-sorting protein [candidate division KSB3 bacterium]|uniref:Outer membrane lipoprotein-sorting protein n=1 Tax=candidate division KSB3 bacterium TaxID=2044937 RepID=A0A2G6E1C1_9BACT|nr:MAG: outer membrane lipoprotein-sorting protein [candidate division KSB3 bacterium]PIE28533.1 MAG: outer membrane lipoprotein-sorting protein [candidate division KSB3 bacterium]
MKQHIFVIAALMILTGMTSSFAAQDLGIDEIINKANLAAYYAGDDGKADVKMVITDKNGQERTREFTILRKDSKEGGEQKFYVYFNRPADVRKMVFMVWKNIDKDDDRWLYMASLDLVKRIAAGDKRTSFVGSDFVYEDVSGRSLAEDEHSLVEHKDGYYKIHNVPKNPGDVEFTHYDIWINDQTFLPEKAEYYKGDSLYRKVSAEKIEEIDGFPTVIVSKVENLETGGSTINTFSNIKYNIGIPDKIFSERYLRRAPKKWLK